MFLQDAILQFPHLPKFNGSPTKDASNEGMNNSRGDLMSDAVQPPSRDPVPTRRGRDFPMSITGVGAVTGYGWGTKHLWDGFLLGESAVTLTGGLEGYVEGGQASLSLITDEGDRRDGPSRFMQAPRHAGRE